MSLVRYGTNVFELEDVYGLDLFQKGDDDWRLRIVMRGGNSSFDLYFDAREEAHEAFDRICRELEVRDLSGSSDADPVAEQTGEADESPAMMT